MSILRRVFVPCLPMFALLAACAVEPSRPDPELELDRVLEIVPAPLSVAIGDSVRLTLQWKRSDGQIVPVTTEVSWSLPTEAQGQLRLGNASGGQTTLRALGPSSGRVEARTQGMLGAAEVKGEIAPFVANTPLRFEAASVWPTLGSVPPVRVTVGAGRLEVQGYAEGGCHRSRLFASARREGSTLRLHIAAEAFSPCAGTVTPYEYTATLDSLPAGSYTLSVVHQQVARSSPAVRDQTLEIPSASALSTRVW